MSLFDIFKKKPKNTGDVAVPEGHEVATFYTSPFPQLDRCRSGMLVAHLGVRGENQKEDVELLFGDVEKALQEHPPECQVFLASNATNLSDLFAPNDPQIQPIQPGVIWAVTTGSLTEFVENIAGVQNLLHLFHHLHVAVPNTPQWLYIDDENCPNIDTITMLLTSLDVQVRTPDERRTVLLEVTRPEGVTIAALPGIPAQVAPPPELLVSINQTKNEAITQKDMEALHRIEEEEKNFLSLKIVDATLSNEDQIGLRAGKIRRLLLSVAENKEDNEKWAELFTTLLERKAPLLFMAGPNGQVAPKSWPGIPSAIPVFTDFLSLKTTADQTGVSLQDGTCGIAQMTTTELCNWVAKIKTEVVLNVFKDLTLPLYIHFGIGTLQALADGRVPTEEERRKKLETY